MNFAQFLEIHARGRPNDLALVDQRLRLSLGELNQLSSRFANYIYQRGLIKGSRIALFLPNRAELVIALLGAMKAGVIAVPINYRLHGLDLAHILDHCAPACLVTTSEKHKASAANWNSPVLSVDDAPETGTFWDRLYKNETTFESVGAQSSDIANLMYTSGTTSTPKAVIHSHGMRVAVAAAMADCFKLSSRDIGLAVSPLFHTSGLSVFFNALFVGCPVILQEKWDLDLFLRLLKTENVTFMHLISTIIVDIARAEEHKFIPNGLKVRFTWSGGHSVEPAKLATFERRIGGVLLQGYSRTEGGLTYNTLDPKLRRFDMHGFANRNSSDVAILNPATHHLCDAGETGEIAVRGDGVTLGYWRGENRDTQTVVADGWQLTGDIGFIDRAGALHFLGRDDDMIKTGGENVYPSEVLPFVLAMPNISDAIVIGVPDDRLGQSIGAIVVQTDPTLSREGFIDACRKVLPGFKTPRVCAFVDELPRLGSQKIDIAACRRILAQTGVS